MPKIKTNKEYAIRLIHPELGEYYFNYINGNNYMFTQTLKKVNTWKTLSIVEKQIAQIIEKLECMSRIIIPLGPELKENFSEDLRLKMIYSKKNYYYPITTVTTKQQLEIAKDNLTRLDESLIVDSENITSIVKKSQHVEKDFIKILKKFSNDINEYRKDYSFLEKNTEELVYLDIVNASYNFRYLKLKTLRDLATEEEEV